VPSDARSGSFGQRRAKRLPRFRETSRVRERISVLVAKDSEELTWTLVAPLVQEFAACDAMPRVERYGHSLDRGGQAFAVASPRIPS